MYGTRHRRRLWSGSDQFVAEPLMVPLFVIVDHEITNDSPKMSLTQGNDAVETLLLDGVHESLSVGVEIRTLRR